MATLTALLDAGTYAETRTALINELTSRGFPATSWQAGSVPLTLLEGAATMIHALKVRIGAVAAGGYLDTAIGEWLDLLAKGIYGLTREPATFTRGDIVLTNTTGSPHTIQARSLWVATAGGLRFTNIAAFTLGANDIADPVWEAESPGAAHNVGLNSITVLQTPIAGVTVNNIGSGSPAVWITVAGKDTESDADLRTRCHSRWPESSETRVPTDLVYDTLAKKGSPEVTRVSVRENVPVDGNVKIRLAGGSGGVSAGAVTAVQTFLAPRRALCTTLNIASASVTTYAVTGSITVKGATIDQAYANVNAELLKLQQSLNIGDNVYRNAIIHAIKSAAGVDRLVLLTPATDQVLAADNVAVFTPPTKASYSLA